MTSDRIDRARVPGRTLGSGSPVHAIGLGSSGSDRAPAALVTAPEALAGIEAHRLAHRGIVFDPAA
jgi:hypothetical protein